MYMYGNVCKSVSIPEKNEGISDTGYPILTGCHHSHWLLVGVSGKGYNTQNYIIAD